MKKITFLILFVLSSLSLAAQNTIVVDNDTKDAIISKLRDNVQTINDKLAENRRYSGKWNNAKRKRTYVFSVYVSKGYVYIAIDNESFNVDDATESQTNAPKPYVAEVFNYKTSSIFFR